MLPILWFQLMDLIKKINNRHTINIRINDGSQRISNANAVSFLSIQNKKNKINIQQIYVGL